MSAHALANLIVVVLLFTAAAGAWAARRSPWWNVVAGGVIRRRPLAALALSGLILAVNELGYAVRDALDPRTRRE